MYYSLLAEIFHEKLQTQIILLPCLYKQNDRYNYANFSSNYQEYIYFLKIPISYNLLNYCSLCSDELSFIPGRLYIKSSWWINYYNENRIKPLTIWERFRIHTFKIKYLEDKLEQFIDYPPNEKKIKNHLGVNCIEVRRNFFLVTTS